MMVAPMPTTTQSAMVAAWIVAPGPIVTLLPMTMGSAWGGRERAGGGGRARGAGAKASLPHAFIQISNAKRPAQRRPAPTTIHPSTRAAPTLPAALFLAT